MILRGVTTGTFAPNALDKSCFDAKICLIIGETDAKQSEEEVVEASAVRMSVSKTSGGVSRAKSCSQTEFWGGIGFLLFGQCNMG